MHKIHLKANTQYTLTRGRMIQTQQQTKWKYLKEMNYF